MALTKPDKLMLDLGPGLRGGSTLTLAGGSVTPVEPSHAIDTEAAASSDDLDTLVVTAIQDGGLLLIRAANTARTVVVKHAADNIFLHGNADMSLDDAEQSLLLRREGANFHEINRTAIVLPRPGLVPITRKTGAAASYDFTTGIDSTYRSYMIRGWMQPAVDDVELRMRTDANGGASFDAAANDYHYAANTMLNVAASDTASVTNAHILLAGLTGATAGVGNAADERALLEVTFENPDNAAFRQALMFRSTCVTAAGVLITTNGAAFRDAPGIVDAIQLYFESGNVAAGDVTLYGLLNGA